MVPEWVHSMNFFYRKGTPFLFILDFNLEGSLVLPIDQIDPREILFHFPCLSNAQEKSNIRSDIHISAYPLKYNDFLEKFLAVQKEIIAGNTYLLNLTFETPIDLNLSLQEVFCLSRARYKLFLKDNFVLFSPESFVKITDGKISTYPMKGTLEKKDNSSVQTLLNDPKEEAEHATITDLLRNDLGRVAENIRVVKYRYLDEIKTQNNTILQVSSEIEGILQNFYKDNPGHLFYELLPAGSVTGAPKKKTVEIIQAVENYKRGFYTGVFGIFDGKNIDSAVMIRFIEKREDHFYYKSGGGITFMSDPEKEYQELKQKIYVPVY